MQLLYQGRSTNVVLAGTVLILIVGCYGGCSVQPVAKVKEYVVELATKTGTIVKERAQSLAEAIEQAWRTFFPRWDKTKTVKITSADGLHGELQGTFQLKIVLPHG